MYKNIFDPSQYVNIDAFRRRHLAIAEFIDAWRIIPRFLVIGYGYMLVTTINWYMGLKPYILPGCTKEIAESCIVHAPTTANTILLSTIVTIAAPILGFYANTGKKWNGFTPWAKTAAPDETVEVIEVPVVEEELPEIPAVPKVPPIKKKKPVKRRV